MKNADENNNNKKSMQDLPQVDLNAFADKFDLQIRSRGREEPEDAHLRRFKDRWLFIATLIAITTVFGICISFLLLKQDSPYTGIALNGVIGLTMALAGYYVRGKTY